MSDWPQLSQVAKGIVTVRKVLSVSRSAGVASVSVAPPRVSAGPLPYASRGPARIRSVCHHVRTRVGFPLQRVGRDTLVDLARCPEAIGRELVTTGRWPAWSYSRAG